MRTKEKDYQIDLEHLIQEFNLPKTTKWIGYAVHLPSKDEFLANVEEEEIGTLRTYTKTPEMAKTWKKAKIAIKQALEIKEKYHDVCVVNLVDIENQIAVLSPKN